jgi:hypothetical protein
VRGSGAGLLGGSGVRVSVLDAVLVKTTAMKQTPLAANELELSETQHHLGPLMIVGGAKAL